MGILQALAAATGPRPSDSLIRAAICELIAHLDRCAPAAICKECWPRDAAVLAVLQRRAVVPTLTANTIDAPAAAAVSIGVGPMSAASQLFT
jgi:hypothetical protein